MSRNFFIRSESYPAKMPSCIIRHSRKLIMKWLTTLVFVLGSTVAHADGGRYALPDHPKWKEECGSCHIAYPPKLLTADDWQKLMAGLDKHFDANATLDAKDSRETLDFLQAYAGFRKRNSASSLRISDTPWFTQEHHEIPDKTWSDPAVKSRSNCTACHINAEHGDWSDKSIRVPGIQYGKGRDERHSRGGKHDDD